MARLLLVLTLLLTLPGTVHATTPNDQQAETPPTGWSIHAIDWADPGSYVHFSYTAIAARDYSAHISYRGPNRDLRYATNMGGCWLTQSLYDEARNVARESSIALDSGGRPHISFSYSDGGAEDLKYAHAAGDGWQIADIDTPGSTGMENSIVLDSNGGSHISHWQWNGSKLKYSTNEGGAWSTETIGDAGWARTSIALDENDGIHVAHAYAGALRVASKENSVWSIAVIDSNGSHPSLAIDAGGYFHVSYASEGKLKYATGLAGSSWSSTLIADANVGRDHALALDSAGKVHISFYDPGAKRLRYANNVSDSWETITIDEGEAVGRSNSIAIDHRDRVHISYRDDGAPAMLWYATDAGIACHRLFLPLVE